MDAGQRECVRCGPCCESAAPERTKLMDNRDETAVVPLVDGTPVLISQRDYAMVSRHRWTRHRPYKVTYARISSRSNACYMHNLILPKREGVSVDHKNGNGLDNRRCNLRYATHAQQAANRCARRWPKGVGRRPWGWVARIGPGGSLRAQGFRSRMLAAFFYDDIALATWGDFARLNFVGDVAPEDAEGIIQEAHGRIFTVAFSRRSDGRFRQMTCRTGVRAHTVGASLPFDPRARNLLSVFDVTKRNYRFIPLERMLCLNINGRRYRVRRGPTQN